MIEKIGKKLCIPGKSFYLIWTSLWISVGMTMLVDYLQKNNINNQLYYWIIISFLLFFITGMLSFLLYTRLVKCEIRYEASSKKENKESFIANNIEGDLPGGYWTIIVIWCFPILGLIALVHYSFLL